MENHKLTGSFPAEADNSLLYIGLSGALAVGLGAFGAHALSDRLSVERLDVYKTAVLYHFVHTLALLAIAAFPTNRRRVIASRAFAVGLVLFCGSLYILATRGLLGLEEAGWIGAITPFGGLAFVAGWVLLAFSRRR